MNLSALPKLFDSYNRVARLYPALLAIAPILCSTIVVLPNEVFVDHDGPKQKIADVKREQYWQVGIGDNRCLDSLPGGTWRNNGPPSKRCNQCRNSGHSMGDRLEAKHIAPKAIGGVLMVQHL